MNFPLSTAKKEECALIKNENGNIYICLKKRGLLGWKPIDTISAANWRKHRELISKNMSNLLKQEEKTKEDIIKSTNSIVFQTKDLFYKVFKNLSIDEKKIFLEENKTSWLTKESCSVCFNKAETRNKCIHNDCPGMCEDCAQDMLDSGGNCKSCLKSQLIECPICYDENPVDKMCKSKTCSHYVCWTCYGKAYHCGKPIESCPSCRADFIEISESEYATSDSDMDVDEDAWGDIDIETIQEIEQNLREIDPDSTHEDVIAAINMIINSTPDEQNEQNEQNEPDVESIRV